MKISFSMFLHLFQQLFLMIILLLMRLIELVDKENLGESSLPMLEVRNSQGEEETSHNNYELRVYSRIFFHQTTRENPNILEGIASMISAQKMLF